MTRNEGKEPPATTLEEVFEEHEDRGKGLANLKRARAWRRVTLAVLVLIVLAGLTNLAGVRYATARASAAGYELSVRYPQIARPGLGVSWSVEIVRPGGFDGEVEVVVDRDYFGLFDENGWSPQPESETAAGQDVIWTFQPPEGDRLVIDLDARMAPSWSWPREGHVAVRAGGADVVAVSFRTWSLP